MVSFRCLNKKPPPEVLEHPERQRKTTIYIISDNIEQVKGVWNESKNPKNQRRSEKADEAGD